MLLSGCAIHPLEVTPSSRMCQKPIGTAYVEPQSRLERVSSRHNYPKEEIERLLIESNCFQLVDGGLSRNDPMYMVQQMSSLGQGDNATPKADYRITSSVVFVETGTNVGYRPYGAYSSPFYANRADKQNERVTIRLVDERTDAVVAIATGEGIYQDAQWDSMGFSTDRSGSRVLEFAYRNAINNLVGQIEHLSFR